MIKSIKIDNFLTIKNLEINFDKHFSAIVGESGAGKSLILKAISEVFSVKNDTQMIGNFGDFCTISIDFDADLSKYGFLERNFSIVKILKKNKSQLTLNDKPISNKIAQNIKNDIVNIVSQDYRFELFEKDRFLEILDLFVDPNAIETYKTSFVNFIEAKKTIHELESKIKFIENAHPEILIELIDKTNPQKDEYDDLINKRKQIKQDLALKDFIQQLNTLFYEDPNNLYDSIIASFKKINNIEPGISPKMQNISNSLSKILDELNTLKPLFEHKKDDEVSIDNIEKRLFELENLQRKFGKTINEIIEEKQKLSQLINEKNSLQEQLLEEKDKLETLKDNLEQAALQLTNQRKHQAECLIAGVKKNMSDLMLEFADFDIVFDKVEFNENGQDKITLLFTANRDLPKKELSKVASGGEKSRFILALFEYIGRLNQNTIVFDEIEEGTGGKTLKAIVSKLKKLSLENQLICITHFVEMQHAADKVFTIEKTFENSNTVTYLCQM
jgi:DNA repair protein RecN (Recombination protein N)